MITGNTVPVGEELPKVSPIFIAGTFKRASRGSGTKVYSNSILPYFGDTGGARKDWCSDQEAIE
jgi:hypothetical protein